MKTETLVQRHPPTPPHGHIHPDLQNGLNQIAQYNAERGFSYDESPSHGTVYSSPGPGMNNGLSHAMGPTGIEYGVGVPYVRDPFLQSDDRLMNSQDDYSRGTAYYRDQYGGIQNDSNIFTGTPSTPQSVSIMEDAVHRTRSGRSVVPSSSPLEDEKPRPKTASKSKKSRTGKSEKPKTPKLTAPLSILTKDMASIPVRNMEEWVNRSAEVRRKEVEKRNGYVTRPMNSFMLYRSAFAERTKQWCLQNNHQVVSSVSGESWPMEPPEVRELYNEYAKIERINHQNAHPTYKFSPSKTTASARKRKGEFSDEEPSDLDDAEWNPGNGRSRTRPSKRMSQNMGYPVNGISHEFFDQRFVANGSNMARSPWDMPSDGRPMPMPMDGPYGQYYQSAMHPGMNMHTGISEDIRLRRADTPISTLQLSPDTALLGLPGGNANELLQQMHSHSGTPLGEAQVDPMLLAFDGGHHHELSVAVTHPEFRNGHLAMIDRELDGHSVDSFIGGPHQSHEEYHSEAWQPDPTIGPMEPPESEFDKWLGDR